MTITDKLSSHLSNARILVSHECSKTKRNEFINGNINEYMKSKKSYLKRLGETSVT